MGSQVVGFPQPHGVVDGGGAGEQSVKIHPFRNGNGRHARMAADLLVTELGASRFSWGGEGYLTAPTDTRKTYLAALRHADVGHVWDQERYAPLLRFARS
jgi:fido (protein-threonine AMPylation protein)